MKTSIDRPWRIAGAERTERRAINGATMGTRYSSVFYASRDFADNVLARALFEAVDRVDRQMSTWKPNSDLNRLNAAPVGQWVDIPWELTMVLAASLRIGHQTHGAFDIGVGDLVAAWGFGPLGRAEVGRAPAEPVVRAVTAQCLELDEVARRARKLAPLCLDLSGIAKGFAVDEMARVMREYAIACCLVGIDGEMRGVGAKPDGAPWAVAHERPDRKIREAMGVIELQDMAVATSGNYRHWIERDGEILSHTMDTARARPLEGTLASVSVLAPSCMIADAWATAVMVLGSRAGLELIRQHGLDAILVHDGGGIEATL